MAETSYTSGMISTIDPLTDDLTIITFEKAPEPPKEMELNMVPFYGTIGQKYIGKMAEIISQIKDNVYYQRISTSDESVSIEMPLEKMKTLERLVRKKRE